ncbi:unnamed protein product [Haemonchus placei]|uniref:Transmembrane protein n=1 Tax=Haemonchus placei TaxID=6290 RepID=A0A0N4W3Q3_HAEPC|nr:unnamed protein product [Haemonchus placei]
MPSQTSTEEQYVVACDIVTGSLYSICVRTNYRLLSLAPPFVAKKAWSCLQKALRANVTRRQRYSRNMHSTTFFVLLFTVVACISYSYSQPCTTAGCEEAVAGDIGLPSEYRRGKWGNREALFATILQWVRFCPPAGYGFHFSGYLIAARTV